MVLKISSKFELRRFCRAAGAVAHVSNFYSHFSLSSEGVFILNDYGTVEIEPAKS